MLLLEPKTTKKTSEIYGKAREKGRDVTQAQEKQA
jgi:hypothetical protein